MGARGHLPPAGEGGLMGARGHLPPAGEVGLTGEAWIAGTEVQPTRKEAGFQPVRLGVRIGTEVPVRTPTTMRDGCAQLTTTIDAVHCAISANHGNRRELAKAIDTLTACSKLLALEESMPLGVITLAEGAKAQCDHQLQRKTADTVASEANQKLRGH